MNHKIALFVLLILLLSSVSCARSDEYIDISVPEDGAITAVTPIHIGGTVLIPAEKVSVNGIPLVLSEKDNFDTGIPLEPGFNKIVFKAMINGQDTVIKVIHVTYIPDVSTE